MTSGAHVGGVRALSGRPVETLTVEAVRAREVGAADLRIHPETLERQAVVAEEHGNPQAENLRRAAELTRPPDDEVLAIYEALRPGRSTAAQLTSLAGLLADRGLPRCTALCNPVRHRVQRVVDRRFNRASYDAGQMVAACAARVQDAVDLGTIRSDLLSTVDRALEPAHVTVWTASAD